MAEATRTIEEVECGSYYGGSDYEENERSEHIGNTWYTEDGDKFPFGRFMDVSLDEDIIGYDEDEWVETDRETEGYMGNAPGTQTTTYSKYVAIFLSEDHQFDILLNGAYGIEGGIEWIKYLLKKNPNCNITDEIARIINKFDGASDRMHIITLLKMLKGQKMWELMSKFINTKLVPLGIGLHGYTTRYNYGYEYYGRHRISGHDTNKGMKSMIKQIIMDYGWKEPIKESVLKLIDCMDRDDCKINSIGHYYDFFNSLVLEKDQDEYFNTNLYETLLNASQELKIENIFTVDICKIVTSYISNDLEEIANRIWANIVKKLNLNNGYQDINHESLFSILRFILLYKFDVQTQEAMLKMFCRGYQRNVKDATKALFMNRWIKCLEAEGGGMDRNTFRSQIKILIANFDPNNKSPTTNTHGYIHMYRINRARPKTSGTSDRNKRIVQIIKLIMKVKDTKLISDFIDTKLTANNIGLHSSTDRIRDIFVEILDKYEWKEPLKSSITRSIEQFQNRQCSCKAMENYFKLPLMLRAIKNKFSANKGSRMEVDDDEDSDIQIISSDKENQNKQNNHNKNKHISVAKKKCTNIDKDACWKEIANKVWNILMVKIDLNGENKIMCKFDAEFMVILFKFMVFNKSTHWDKDYANKIFRRLKEGYEKSNDIIKTNIILKLKQNEFTWKMLDGYNGTIGDLEYENFLKSNQEKFSKRGFSSIVQARKWHRTHSRSINSMSQYYTVRFEQASGRGRQSVVNVTKTRQYWNKRILQKCDQYRNLGYVLSLIKL